jgi:hypothetical protein
METQFYILLTFKTERGLESFAKFFVGNNRERAVAIFEKLRGKREISEKDVLFIDFMETIEGLPFNLDCISCTLGELAENCATITKEVFISQNLDIS